MKRKTYLAGFLILLMWSFIVPRSWGASISGVVKDKKGAGLLGVMVTVNALGKGIATSVITNQEGKYQLVDLTEGDYLVRVARLGFKEEEKRLSLTQDLEMDFSLEEGEAEDISKRASSSDWLAALPSGHGDIKERLIIGCLECHGMEKIVEHMGWSEEEWRRSVNKMVDWTNAEITSAPKEIGEAMAEIGAETLFPSWFGLEAIIGYLTEHFGPDSPPLQPRILPPTTGAATQMIITEWDLPKMSSAATHTLAIDPKTGLVWITDTYTYGEIIRLDPSTGATKIYKLPVPPGEKRVGAHDVVFGKEGKIWMPLILGNAIVRFDPETEEFTRWKVPTPNSGPHTLRFDSKGNVWFTQFGVDQFAKLDPKTGKFVEYKIPGRPAKMPYGLTVDQQDNVWVCELFGNRLTKYDPRTDKITSYKPPSPYASVRRADFDSQGNIWFTEFVPGKLGKFDPRTESFKEYDIPTPYSAPYGIAVDRRTDVVWASGYASNKVIRLDSKTETFTEYQLPTPIVSIIRNLRIEPSTNTVWGVYGNFADPHARVMRLKFQ